MREKEIERKRNKERKEEEREEKREARNWRGVDSLPPTSPPQQCQSRA